MQIRAVGIAGGHVLRKDCDRLPEVSADPLRARIFGLRKKRGDGRGVLDLAGGGRVFVGRPLPAQFKAELLVLFAGDAFLERGPEVDPQKSERAEN